VTDAAGALTRGRVLAIVGAFVAVGAVLAVLADPSLLVGRASGAWHMASPRLSTPWTHDVSPSNALPDYPRPELTRPLWRSLNGVWQFSGASSDEHPPFGQTLDERVLVPYPIESALSGIERHEDRMWYRRTFQVPKSWHVGSGRRLMLNFGAVDYDASVYVNGTKVAAHHGGYTKFSADVTRALNPRGEQELVVGVTDLADKTWQPVGKQRNDPEPGAFYEGASGIWQSVWMEPVSVGGHVRNLRMTPDIDSDILRLTVDAVGAAGARVDVVVESGGKRISTVTGRPGRTIQVPVKHARLWSPNDPFLYTLTVTLARGNAVVDRVGSYFGMREIGTARGPDGKLRITLNHKPTFLMATLDQGYWPDGIYTAPTDAALRFDIAKTKALGFNTIRKHM
jgi:beta-galactosidase/beta-glucuronidase